MDDTDSPSGGCTTFTLTEILHVASREGVGLIGEPRLVRLNPNVPWKTRGNAALSAHFGVGAGARVRVGGSSAGPLWGYRKGRALPTATRDRFVENAWKSVLVSSRVGDPGTDPAMVVSPRRLDSALYQEAVRSVVTVERALGFLEGNGGAAFHGPSLRGVVGASAAIAWPARRCTWELIAYRGPGEHPLRRQIDPVSVDAAARRYRSLFLCTDPRTRRLMVAPHTRCPVLLGLRSSKREALVPSFRMIRAEAAERWVIFRTNQGTGDHLAPRLSGDLAPYESGTVEGTLAQGPRSLVGGHVQLEIVPETGGSLPAIVFEPSKTLPRVARSLQAGDTVRLWGGRGADRTFRVEGITVRRLVPRSRTRAPTCPECGRATHSMGTGRGYRCRRCRRRFPPEAGRGPGVPPEFLPGTYHPTPSARRHLHPRGPEGWEFFEPEGRSAGPR